MMSIIILAALTSLVSITALYCWGMHVTRLERDTNERTIAAQPSSRFQPPERPAPLVAWTPEERAAYGIDDTDAWIAETQRTLNQREWATITCGRITAEKIQADEVVELRAWGSPEPILRHNDELPTVTGKRVFG